MIKFQPIINFIRDLYNKPSGPVPLHAPVFKGNEKRYIEECINSTFVSSIGRFVDKYENEMADYTGSNKAVACVNGTSALHLALILTGVESGNEVITQPLTFIATANAITYCGAKPVFLDVDMDTMGLSPDKMKHWLKQNTVFKKKGTKIHRPINKTTGNIVAACLPMHTFGHPCRIDEIVEICDQYNIPVIEDAAESLGSIYKGKHTGNYGKIGVLSFNGNKILTTGGGGMLLFQDEILAKRAKHLTTQAKVHHPWEFIHDEIAFNYRMPNLNAAVGLAQLEQLDIFLSSKRDLAEKYREFFDNSDFTFMKEPKDTRSNYWLNCILLKDKTQRDEFLQITNSNGVMTRPAWQLINTLLMFKDCQTGELINATRLVNRLVNLPSSVRL